MWGTVLSDPLPIVDQVGRHPACHLMGRMPVPRRVSALPLEGCPPRGPWRITRRFHRLSACRGWVAYALRTRPPLSCPRRGTPVRLACIRPAASVHPEPGSNSSLYYCFYLIDFCLMGSAFLYLLRFLIRQPVRPRGSPAVCLVLASSSQRSFPQKPLPSFLPLFPSLAGCKNTTFYITSKHFFHFFCKIIGMTLVFKEKNFRHRQASPENGHLLIYKDGGTAADRGRLGPLLCATPQQKRRHCMPPRTTRTKIVVSLRTSTINNKLAKFFPNCRLNGP